MAFINSNGERISYDCSDLIEELRDDIEEFGGDTVVNVWCREDQGVTLYTNYDFIRFFLHLITLSNKSIKTI